MTSQPGSILRDNVSGTIILSKILYGDPLTYQVPETFPPYISVCAFTDMEIKIKTEISLRIFI
jgi:hypothetical protein